MPDSDTELHSSSLTVAWSKVISEPANPWSSCRCAPLAPAHENPASSSCLSSLHGLFRVVHTSLAFASIFDRCFFRFLHVLWWFAYALSCAKLLQEHPLLVWPLFIFLLILAFYLYPEDYTCIHMHYLFWLVPLSPYLFWLQSLWSISCSLVLYLLARSPARSPMPLPLYWCPPYYILSPILLHQSMTLSPYTLTVSLVYDSASPLPLPYHQSVTHSLSLTSFYTSTYSLVCARSTHLYKPYVPQLYSLTWIYLVLPSDLVQNLLSFTHTCDHRTLLWPLVIASWSIRSLCHRTLQLRL
jgi:hypothetical protein